MPQLSKPKDTFKQIFEKQDVIKRQALPKYLKKASDTGYEFNLLPYHPGWQTRPGDLMISGHGTANEYGIWNSDGPESRGLKNQIGVSASLSDIADLLGAGTNDVYRIINNACYGANMEPNMFTNRFPNVTNVVQTPPDLPTSNIRAAYAADPTLATNRFSAEAIDSSLKNPKLGSFRDYSLPYTNSMFTAPITKNWNKK
jgi:hypothetical protein